MDPESLAAVIAALNEAKVIYVVAGGIAVIAHGHARTTTDLDLVVWLDAVNCRNAITSLATLGYGPKIPVKAEEFADAAIRERWIQEKGMVVFQLISDRHRRCPIDIFVREPFDVVREASAAKQLDLVPGATVPVVRFETLVALKESANRPIDRDDIEKLRRLRKLLGES